VSGLRTHILLARPLRGAFQVPRIMDTS